MCLFGSNFEHTTPIVAGSALAGFTGLFGSNFEGIQALFLQKRHIYVKQDPYTKH